MREVIERQSEMKNARKWGIKKPNKNVYIQN
jgi:hypothetical protein